MDDLISRRLDRVEERLDRQGTNLRETMNTRIGALEKRFTSLNDSLFTSVMTFCVIVLWVFAGLTLGIALSH
jgi:hypothetical protein